MEYIFNNNHSIFIIEARKRVIDLVTFLVELHNDDLFEEKTYTKFSNLIQELIDLDSVEFIDLKRILKVIDVIIVIIYQLFISIKKSYKLLACIIILF